MVLACLTAASVMVARGQMVVIAYDGFSYEAGALTGENGGTGWSSSWIQDYGSGATLNVDTTGWTYPGLTTEGGRLVWGSGGNGISQNSRTLPRVDSGVVYLQFLGQFGSSSGGGTPNLRLYDSGSLTGGLGGNGGTYGSYVSLLDTNLQPLADGSSASSALLSAQNLMVARIDYDNPTMSLWVNPDLSTFDYASPGTPDAEYAGLAPVFDQIAIYTRNPGSLDELTVLSVAVPEPAWAALVFGLGCAALGGWRYRRDRSVLGAGQE